MFFKKGILKISQNSRENTCAKLFFNKIAACNFIKKTMAQVFLCQILDIFKNTFLQDTLERFILEVERLFFHFFSLIFFSFL